MALEHTTIKAGIAAAAAHVIGNSDDPDAAAKTVAGVASTARKAASGLKSAAARARDVVQDTLESANGVADQPSRTNAEHATTAAAQQPTNSGLQAFVSSFKASFAGRQAELPPPDPNAAVMQIVREVKSTSLVVVNRAGDLVAAATPSLPKPVQSLARGIGRKLTGADVAYWIKGLEHTHGFIGGTAKRTTLKVLLQRMRVPDAHVFEALDSFSNGSGERLKALRLIATAIRDMPVSAETLTKVIDEFRLTNGKPDDDARFKALGYLVKNIESRAAAAEFLRSFGDDDEKHRLRALQAFAETYSTITCADAVALLGAFQERRADADKILRRLISDTENIASVDALFAPAKTLKDMPELQALGGAARKLASGLFSRLNNIGK